MNISDHFMIVRNTPVDWAPVTEVNARLDQQHSSVVFYVRGGQGSHKSFRHGS